MYNDKGQKFNVKYEWNDDWGWLISKDRIYFKLYVKYIKETLNNNQSGTWV